MHQEARALPSPECLANMCWVWAEGRRLGSSLCGHSPTVLWSHPKKQKDFLETAGLAHVGSERLWDTFFFFLMLDGTHSHKKISPGRALHILCSRVVIVGGCGRAASGDRGWDHAPPWGMSKELEVTSWIGLGWGVSLAWMCLCMYAHTHTSCSIQWLTAVPFIWQSRIVLKTGCRNWKVRLHHLWVNKHEVKAKFYTP